MAYLIGNTTVITNNGALGTVDGNSLNLANNNNIAAGGGAVSALNSSSNFADSNLGSTAAVAVGIGGGGGGQGFNQWGGIGAIVTEVFELTGNNITATVGGAGNAIPGPQNSYSPSGGGTTISGSGSVNTRAGGGQGARGNGGGGNPGSGLGPNTYPGSNKRGMFANKGGGGASYYYSAYSGQAGYLCFLGVT